MSQFSKQGKLRALAAAGPTGLSVPVPTYAEAGLPGYHPLGSWGGIVAPRGTPAAILTKISSDVMTVMRHPEVQAIYRAQGSTPLGNNIAEFKQVIKTDMQTWARAVRDSGAKLD